jgi:hypothetical protein
MTVAALLFSGTIRTVPLKGGRKSYKISVKTNGLLGRAQTTASTNVQGRQRRPQARLTVTFSTLFHKLFSHKPNSFKCKICYQLRELETEHSSKNKTHRINVLPNSNNTLISGKYYTDGDEIMKAGMIFILYVA